MFLCFLSLPIEEITEPIFLLEAIEVIDSLLDELTKISNQQVVNLFNYLNYY